jgi:hypothetical protein
VQVQHARNREGFGIGDGCIVCPKCQSPLRLIALVKNRDTAKRILTAMHLPTEVPELHPARPPPRAGREARDGEEWLN